MEINGLYHSGRHDGTVQLAYIDLKNLREENLVKKPVDGSLWIKIEGFTKQTQKCAKLITLFYGLMGFNSFIFRTFAPDFQSPPRGF